MNEWLPKFKGDDLLKRITEFSKGLTYISETDAGIQAFSRGQVDAVEARYLFERGSHKKELTEISFEEFFRRLTEQKEWFGPKQRENAKRFAALEKLLKENLRDRKVFKVGRIQIDIYVVGLDADKNLTGIKTKAVET